MTDKRVKEKQINKSEHPILGKVKVVLGPNRTGLISVREGYDPEQLAESFMNSYSIKKDHKDKIINHIKQVINQKLMKDAKKNMSSPESEQNISLSNDMQSITEESPEDNSDKKYVNIPVSHSFGQNNLPSRNVGYVNPPNENSNPNSYMMSPHFREQSLETSEHADHHAYVQKYSLDKSPSFAPMDQNPRESREQIEFEGFSPESSGPLPRRGSVVNNFLPQPIESTKSEKRCNSKQSSRGRGRNLLYKVKIQLEDQASISVNVREGDNLYTLANEVVKQYGLDHDVVHQIRDLLAKPSQFKK